METSEINTDKGILYAILSVMPSIGSVWGLVLYAVFSYLVTFIIIGGVNYWANKNIDVNKIIK